MENYKREVQDIAISDNIQPIQLKSKKTNNTGRDGSAREASKPYQPISLEIFSANHRPINEARNQYKEKFGSDEIQIGKTSTKRATNLASFKDKEELGKIFQGRSGQQIVRGRGNRATPADSPGGPRPLHEIRSVQYEEQAAASMAANTVMMAQSNHIMESHVDQPIGDGLNPDGAVSRNYFAEERNTMMAGDLRENNQNKDRLDAMAKSHNANTPQPHAINESNPVYLGSYEDIPKQPTPARSYQEREFPNNS